MTPEKAVEILERQKAEIPTIQQERRNTGKNPRFTLWDRNTKTAISKIFGQDSDHKKEFSSINYSVMAFFGDTPNSVFDNAFCHGLDEASSLLTSMIAEIKEYGISGNFIETKNEPVDIVQLICHQFHKVARQLQQRHDDRQTIEINDEYDVQDLFHALLKIHFDDVRPEEYTPSYAGSSTRVDFLLKNEKIVIELKKTRKGLRQKEVGEQLIIDIAHYQTHPDCKTLICFVYDPEGRIANPIGVENDLERCTNAINVKVIISPK
ncbi:hypothetical protein PZA20_05220 [Pectobacterium polaris]|uniref:PD-(D/E)XK nuclease domain-containing protein n=1 Tax=Pectobacterium polaris TaxID=2042057 RepID=UPI0023B08994|nr:hypothetical protein [Pectobacterium polaris]MDE8741218.1 hypothetical protein [Pectobacterium polaris]